MALVRKIIGNVKPRLAHFKAYAQAELAPPSPAELMGAAKAAGHLGQSIVKGDENTRAVIYCLILKEVSGGK